MTWGAATESPPCTAWHVAWLRWCMHACGHGPHGRKGVGCCGKRIVLGAPTHPNCRIRKREDADPALATAPWGADPHKAREEGEGHDGNDSRELTGPQQDGMGTWLTLPHDTLLRW
jgi:hypothetical protein